MNTYLELAINEAMQGIENGDGAPFGACIVNKGQIIALAHVPQLISNNLQLSCLFNGQSI
jgi:tRNA(Arg) A34 adenosine deaminase TadA